MINSDNGLVLKIHDMKKAKLFLYMLFINVSNIIVSPK